MLLCSVDTLPGLEQAGCVPLLVGAAALESMASTIATRRSCGASELWAKTLMNTEVPEMPNKTRCLGLPKFSDFQNLRYEKDVFQATFYNCPILVEAFW